MHDKALVGGIGIIAQLVGGQLKKTVVSLLAMSRINDNQIDKAREIGDFDIYFDDNDPERGFRFMEASNGGFDTVFEAVGSSESMQTCLETTKPGGEIVAISNSIASTITFNLNALVLNEIRLNGSVSSTRKEFAETIDLIASGFVDPENM